MTVQRVPALGTRLERATFGQAADRRVVRVEHIMGTAIRVELLDGRGRDELIDEVFAWFETVDARFSMFQPASEMSRVARGELRESDAHPDIREVIDACEAVWVRSGCAFDIRNHRQDGLLDPTGLVKGWSVDRAADLLLAKGVTDWSINAGGDIRVSGQPLPGQVWRIGIQHPRQRDAVAAVVFATDVAVATSGSYERGDHIVDPRNGDRPVELLSVTVVGPRLALADAYATAAFSMGSDAARWLAALPDYEGVVISTGDRVVYTDGMDRYTGSVVTG